LRSYPSFIDALRDLDDPLTMVHLFATLPAEKRYEIPRKQVRAAGAGGQRPPPRSRAAAPPGAGCRDARGQQLPSRALALAAASSCLKPPPLRPYPPHTHPHTPPRPLQVDMARRLALEWQAFVVRSNSLRKVFVSVKGFYYQAEVMGQPVTWLVPHQLAQVRAAAAATTLHRRCRRPLPGRAGLHALSWALGQRRGPHCCPALRP
jgi:hypothetical protein